MDTIFALASARGKSGVAVIRVSGPAARDAARNLAGAVPPARQAVLRKLMWRGNLLDQALVLWFDRDASFTGEDVLELQTHGSQAVVAAVLSALAEMPELRLSEPGEFTRRALENGRLDLAQVEGLADLIDAETEAQRLQALRVFSGAIGERLAGWRAAILRARALIEATIDFADEDVPVDVTPEVRAIVDGLVGNLRTEIAGSEVAERVRDGFEVAIIGAPNVGKSTLLNAIAGRQAALTSEYAGTTRDVIEVRMDLGGLAVTLLDTAGLRQTQDLVEGMGIERAVERARSADLRVFLLAHPDEKLDLTPAQDDIVVVGKADTLSGDGFRISGLTGLGVPELLDRITTVLAGRAASAGTMTRARHRVAMVRAVAALENVRIALDNTSYQPELVAEQLRHAAGELEVLIGRVDVEGLLGEIFSRFCIGK